MYRIMPLRSGPPARLAIPADNSNAGTRGRAFLQHGDSGGAASSGQANVPSTARVHTKKGACMDALQSSGGEARIRTGGKGFAGLCLTTWPLRRYAKGRKKGIGPQASNGADNGARTRDPNLGKVVLYQLSHVRLRESNIRDSWGRCKRNLKKICAALKW